MSIPKIAFLGAIIQLAIWTPIWLLLVADAVWAAFPFKVAALINIYLAFAPLLVTWMVIMWKLRK